MRALVVLSALISALPAQAQSLELRAADPPTLAIGAAVLVGLVCLPILLWLRQRLHKAMEEVRRCEAERTRLAEILAASPDGFYRWDVSPDGGVEGVHCSRRLAVLLGLFAGTEATYEDVKGSFGTSETAVLDAAVASLQGSGNGFELELGLRDGHRRVLVVGCRAADSDGRALADLLWMRDVTEGAAAGRWVSMRAVDPFVTASATAGASGLNLPSPLPSDTRTGSGTGPMSS